MAMNDYARRVAAECGLNPRQTEEEVLAALANAEYSALARLANCGGSVLPGQLLWVIERAREEKARRLATITGTPLERLVALGDRARFADFRNLKSGQDKFSRLRIDQLTTLVTAEDIKVIADHKLSDTDRAKALRWVCRGLPALMAVQKVAVDAEVARQAIRHRHDEDEPDYDYVETTELFRDHF